MITLFKWVLAFTLFIAAKPKAYKQDLIYTDYLVKTKLDSTASKAFLILENKCNICHTKRNRKRIFTTENMNAFKDDIYKQVFIKRRMPKGKKIKLNSTEYQQLLTWISTTQNETYGNKI